MFDFWFGGERGGRNFSLDGEGERALGLYGYGCERERETCKILTSVSLMAASTWKSGSGGYIAVDMDMYKRKMRKME